MKVTDCRKAPGGALTLVEITAGSWRLTVQDRGWLTQTPFISLRAEDGGFGLEWYYVWPFYQSQPTFELPSLSVESPPSEWLELVQLDEKSQIAVACYMLGLWNSEDKWYDLPLSIRLMVESLAGNTEVDEDLLLADRPFVVTSTWMSRFFELLAAPSLCQPATAACLLYSWERYKRAEPFKVPNMAMISTQKEKAPTVPEQAMLATVCCNLLTNHQSRRGDRGVAITSYLDCLYPRFRKQMVGYGEARLRKLHEVLAALELGVL